MTKNVKTDKISSIKNILIITLSNIGDAVLTLPVLANLSVIFPQAKITLLCGPRAVPVFIDDSRISELIIYDKHIPLRSKFSLLIELRAKRFDFVVDLRNTLFPVLSGARHRTSLWRKPGRNLIHRRDIHLWKLESLGVNIDPQIKPLIWLSEADKEYARHALSSLLSIDSLPDSKTRRQIIALAPGARSHIKRWPEEYFVDLGQRFLASTNIEKIVLLGSKEEADLCQRVKKGIDSIHLGQKKNNCCLNLAGRTTLKQAAAVLTECWFLVCNDTALMHIGSAVGIPVMAIFGPTNELKYRPLSPNSQVIRKKLTCTPCESAQCRFETCDCLRQLSGKEVFKRISQILSA